MKIIYSSKFLRNYKKLDYHLRLATKSSEQIFQVNPFDPRLRTHKLKGRLNDCWSFSVDYEYRIIFEFVSDAIIYFHSIGKHNMYNRFLK